jgi:hypothetical protein
MDQASSTWNASVSPSAISIESFVVPLIKYVDYDFWPIISLPPGSASFVCPFDSKRCAVSDAKMHYLCSPYHDWNERVTAECYAPNAAARELRASHRISRMANNYATIRHGSKGP